MVDSLKGAEAVNGEAHKHPGTRDDETDGENQKLDSRQNEGNGSIRQAGHHVVHGQLGTGNIRHDDFPGKDAVDEDGLVGGDVGGHRCAPGIGGAKSDLWQN